jgi:hypothetical protein
MNEYADEHSPPPRLPTPPSGLRRTCRRASDDELFSWRPLALLTLGLLLLRFALALAVSRPTIMMDERCYLTMARALADGILPYSREYGPLYPALLAPVAALRGADSYLLAQLASCVISVSVVPLTFLLLRGSASHRMALWAAALVGLLPSHLMAAPLLMAENLFFPLIVLTAWCTQRAIREPRSYLPLVCASVALVLTKKLGWAIVAGSSGFLLLSLWDRRRLWARCTFLIPLGAAAAASVVWNVVGSLSAPLCQGLTPTTVVPSTSTFHLAQDTFLRHLVPLTAHPLALGFVAWVRWMLAHASYLAVVCAWLPVLLSPWRNQGPSVALLGLCIALSLMAFSSHHNLEGWQRDQYIRARYVDGALPLLLAPCVLLALQRRHRPGTTVLCAGLLLALLFRPEDAAHGQNRNLAWLSPFLQGFLLPAGAAVWTARAFVAVSCTTVWFALRHPRCSPRAIAGALCLFMLATDGAATIRLLSQQAWARDYSSIALWLRTHGPPRPLIAVEREETPQKDKELGLTWVMEQILFWTDATFVRAAREAPFLLSMRKYPLPVLSESRYGSRRTYYLYDRRPSRP